MFVWRWGCMDAELAVSQKERGRLTGMRAVNTDKSRKRIWAPLICTIRQQKSISKSLRRSPEIRMIKLLQTWQTSPEISFHSFRGREEELSRLTWREVAAAITTPAYPESFEPGREDVCLRGCLNNLFIWDFLPRGTDSRRLSLNNGEATVAQMEARIGEEGTRNMMECFIRFDVCVEMGIHECRARCVPEREGWSPYWDTCGQY
ncbi:hypothetical protein CEXT_624051 [Caerostris extrusa]|uniref:Uncharacterized protein n=1 Tax=Caerostris extrusa TaxID=172846 RepID=A0AAV4N016_CAEEX|nr:hypothetical protein CEXT_624051 [Caerostris extrusa]